MAFAQMLERGLSVSAKADLHKIQNNRKSKQYKKLLKIKKRLDKKA